MPFKAECCWRLFRPCKIPRDPAAWHPEKSWSKLTACTFLQAHCKLPGGHEGSESSNQSEGSIIRDSLGFKSANAIKLSSQVCGTSNIFTLQLSQCHVMCCMLSNRRMPVPKQRCHLT